MDWPWVLFFGALPFLFVFDSFFPFFIVMLVPLFVVVHDLLTYIGNISVTVRGRQTLQCRGGSNRGRVTSGKNLGASLRVLCVSFVKPPMSNRTPAPGERRN